MNTENILLIFFPAIIYILVGISLKTFPISLPPLDNNRPYDISRFMSHNGISLGLFNLTRNEQAGFNKIAPKAFIVFGILSGVCSGLIAFLFPLWNKQFICLINALAVVVLLIYIIRKVKQQTKSNL